MNRYSFSNPDLDKYGKVIFEIIYKQIGTYTAEEIQKSNKYILDTTHPVAFTTKPDVFTDDVKEKMLANRKGREKKFIVSYGPIVYRNNTRGKTELVFSGYWE